MTLDDVMGLFNELADDSDTESEQLPAPKPPSAAPLHVVGNGVRKSDGSPLGHVRTRDGSRRLIYESRLDESSYTLYNRVFGGIRIILLKRRPKIGNPAAGGGRAQCINSLRCHSLRAQLINRQDEGVQRVARDVRRTQPGMGRKQKCNFEKLKKNRGPSEHPDPRSHTGPMHTMALAPHAAATAPPLSQPCRR